MECTSAIVSGQVEITTLKVSQGNTGKLSSVNPDLIPSLHPVGDKKLDISIRSLFNFCSIVKI